MPSLIALLESVSALANFILISAAVLAVGIGGPYAFILASVGDQRALARLGVAALALLAPLGSVCTVLGTLTLVCRLCMQAG